MRKVFFPFIFCVSCLLVSTAIVWTEDERVLYEGDSLYHHIRVSEVGGYRYLSFNRTRGNQSVTSIHDPFELKFAYTRASFVVPAFLDREPERILFVGLGGGSIPRVMAKYYPEARLLYGHQLCVLGFWLVGPTWLSASRQQDGNRHP